jgi:hypothetical protein
MFCVVLLSLVIFVLVYMDLSKILDWNVWGLNQKSRHDAIRCKVDSRRSNVVRLQETKRAAISCWMVMSTLGVEFAFLLEAGTCGGILMAWRGSVCKVLATMVDAFSVLVQFDQPEGSPWWFIGVYGPQPDELKI